MKAQGVTQAQLVTKTGLAPRTVSLVLSGKHDFKASSMLAIAEVLGLKPTANAPKRTATVPSGLSPEQNKAWTSALTGLTTHMHQAISDMTATSAAPAST